MQNRLFQKDQASKRPRRQKFYAKKFVVKGPSARYDVLKMIHKKCFFQFILDPPLLTIFDIAKVPPEVKDAGYN